jgi:light-regulated signal transduction histidine kinase (bacteriophytochrome)
MTNGDVRDQLEQDNAELTRSNRELEEFAYVASHDLKSPLLIVQGFLDLLDRTKRDQLDDDARMYIDAALRGAARMEQLIDDLLVYSRVGRNDHDRQWVDLGEIVAQVVADAGPVIKEAGARVMLGPLPSARGNSTSLHQLFENLISNALKFRRSDVVLTVEVAAESRNGEWLVRVTDNGVGIPREHRESVFAMFSRLAQTVDRPGSGIGLAICHRVVQTHGGRMWVEDGANGGATVCLTLPA